MTRSRSSRRRSAASKRRAAVAARRRKTQKQELESEEQEESAKSSKMPAAKGDETPTSMARLYQYMRHYIKGASAAPQPQAVAIPDAAGAPLAPAAAEEKTIETE